MYMNSSGMEEASWREAQKEALGEPSGRLPHPMA